MIKHYAYDFVTVASDGENYIIADKNGGSFYLPKQMKAAFSSPLSVGEVLHITAEQPLEMTELAGTNSIISQGDVKIHRTGSLLKEGKTAEFLVSNTAYGSVLLTDTATGRDYVIFTSYVMEGYYTAGASWSFVTEGNLVRFLLFGDMPVMPVPRRKYILHRKNKKTPTVRSFLNNTYGASIGASMSSASPNSSSTGMVS